MGKTDRGREVAGSGKKACVESAEVGKSLRRKNGSGKKACVESAEAG